jgi:predicted small lipoprotein YifL
MSRRILAVAKRPWPMAPGRALSLAIALLATAGCGQTGPLTLARPPADAGATEPPAEAPNEDENDTEQDER